MAPPGEMIPRRLRFKIASHLRRADQVRPLFFFLVAENWAVKTRAPFFGGRVVGTTTGAGPETEPRLGDRTRPILGPNPGPDPHLQPSSSGLVAACFWIASSFLLWEGLLLGQRARQAEAASSVLEYRYGGKMHDSTPAPIQNRIASANGRSGQLTVSLGGCNLVAENWAALKKRGSCCGHHKTPHY